MDILPDDAPAPRLCHLIKWPDFDGYGFNLHAERSNPGQFIGKIDDDSPAQMAGLREGDKIIEVNGVNISNENHRQVVERIKADPQETKLLVVDQETDLWYKEQDIVIKSSQLNVVYVKTPIPRPLPDSPRAKFHQSPPTSQANESGEATTTDSGSVIANSSSDAQQTQQVSLSPSTLGGSSSLETSDFNEDSIEQQQIIKQLQQREESIKKSEVKQNNSSQIKQQTSGSKASPPMSPDSGKGDEEPANVVTIEAEINRQSPQKQQLLMKEDDEEEEEEGDFKKSRGKQVNSNNFQQQELNEDDIASKSIEPDSLSGRSSQKSPPNSCQVSKVRSVSFDSRSCRLSFNMISASTLLRSPSFRKVLLCNEMKLGVG